MHNLRFPLIPHKKAILWGPHDFAIATLGMALKQLFYTMTFPNIELRICSQ